MRLGLLSKPNITADVGASTAPVRAAGRSVLIRPLPTYVSTYPAKPINATIPAVRPAGGPVRALYLRGSLADAVAAADFPNPNVHAYLPTSVQPLKPSQPLYLRSSREDAAVVADYPNTGIHAFLPAPSLPVKPGQPLYLRGSREDAVVADYPNLNVRAYIPSVALAKAPAQPLYLRSLDATPLAVQPAGDRIFLFVPAASGSRGVSVFLRSTGDGGPAVVPVVPGRALGRHYLGGIRRGARAAGGRR